MGRKIFYSVAFIVFLSGCNEQNNISRLNNVDIDQIKDDADTIQQLNRTISTTQSKEYLFNGGDTILVHLYSTDSSKNSLFFDVVVQGNKFEGVAH